MGCIRVLAHESSFVNTDVHSVLVTGTHRIWVCYGGECVILERDGQK